MSKKNRLRQRELEAAKPIITLACPMPSPATAAAAEALTRLPVEVDEVLERAQQRAVERIGAAIDRMVTCDRLVTYDSLFWRCACGATGRVGRTPEGMPMLDAAVRGHVQSEQLAELPPHWAGQFVLEHSKGV